MTKKRAVPHISLVKIALAATVGLILLAAVGSTVVIDKRHEVERLVVSALGKSGLGETRLIRSRDEKVRGIPSRVVSIREYNAPASLDLAVVDKGLRKAFSSSGLAVSRSERVVDGDIESRLIGVSFSGWEVLRLRINRSRALGQRPTGGRSGPARIAIIVDDFGYNVSNLDGFLGLGVPLTFSILPRLPHSAQVALAVRARGREAILHLPMESERDDVSEERDTITTSMNEAEILKRLESDITSIPGLKGVSNHMGSKATADVRVMGAVMKRLKMRGLYFVDSVTTPSSVCRKAAYSSGVKFVSRDVFLDNESSESYIRAQLEALKAVAMRRGYAVGVCHDRKETLKALSVALPGLVSQGVTFVSASELAT